MGTFAFAVGLMGPALALLAGFVYFTVQVMSGPRQPGQAQKTERPLSAGRRARPKRESAGSSSGRPHARPVRRRAVQALRGRQPR